ncbi:MAG: hypothetical protein L6Q45_12685 [Anaerolineales bacterium]|nr:hypothetical protein [Anaerolineales bacterium]
MPIELVALVIPLMIAAVNSSGQILTAFVSKTKETVAKTKETVSSYIFDKAFVEKVVFDSTEQLASLVNTTSIELKEEIREQFILDVIQDLQAHIISVGSLLRLAESEEIDPIFAERLISNGLYPLQVSLAKTEQRLKFHKKDHLWLYCHLIGTNTLVAGYAYLGQNPPTLQKDLEDSIYLFQKHLLDSIAYTSTKSGIPIPWDRIPRLVKTDGVDELIELYNSVTAENVDEEKNISIKVHKDAVQLFIDAIRSFQRVNKDNKQIDLVSANDTLYKIENMFTWSDFQKNLLSVSLKKEEWITLSKILTVSMPVIRPNTKEFSDWGKQITQLISKEVTAI